MGVICSELHLVCILFKWWVSKYWDICLNTFILFSFQKNKFVVHKNTPAVNKLLTEVSHLVKVIPITFPNGLPENESDFEHCYLRDNGEFVIHKRIVPVEEVDEEENVWKIHDKTLQKYTKRKLVQFRVNTEYFPTQYVYKHNQDSKEHRYTGDHDVGSNRHDWYWTGLPLIVQCLYGNKIVHSFVSNVLFMEWNLYN